MHFNSFRKCVADGRCLGSSRVASIYTADNFYSTQGWGCNSSAAFIWGVNISHESGRIRGLPFIRVYIMHIWCMSSNLPSISPISPSFIRASLQCPDVFRAQISVHIARSCFLSSQFHNRNEEFPMIDMRVGCAREGKWRGKIPVKPVIMADTSASPGSGAIG